LGHDLVFGKSPFHAAEPHNKGRNNASAELFSDFPKRLFFVSSAGNPALVLDKWTAAFSFGSFSLGKQRK